MHVMHGLSEIPEMLTTAPSFLHDAKLPEKLEKKTLQVLHTSKGSLISNEEIYLTYFFPT